MPATWPDCLPLRPFESLTSLFLHSRTYAPRRSVDASAPTDASLGSRSLQVTGSLDRWCC